jgi:hypothetical protein
MEDIPYASEKSQHTWVKKSQDLSSSPSTSCVDFTSYLSVVLNNASYVFFLVARHQWGNENTHFPLPVVP